MDVISSSFNCYEFLFDRVSNENRKLFEGYVPYIGKYISLFDKINDKSFYILYKIGT